jgi:hypothetical protein
MGGALVTSIHRKRGLLNCFGVVCLVAHRLMNRTVKKVGDTERRIVGRVLKGNPHPIKSLERMHFDFVKEIEIDPKGKKGVQAMPLNKAGRVEALEFVFDERFFAPYVKLAIEYRDRGTISGKDGVVSKIQVNIPALLEEDGIDPLRALLDDLTAR